jgi:4'-phosphopantetheinyl transferase
MTSDRGSENSPGGVVDICVVSALGAEEHLSDCLSILAPGEIERAEGFRAPRDQLRFVIFRAALRRLLGFRLGISAADVTFHTGPWGKPRLPVGQGLTLHFNLSHSGDLAAIALCRSAPVGVDIEHLREISERDRLAKRIMSEREHHVFAGLAEAARSLALLRAWTGKEAFLKGIGEGLYRPLSEVEVTFAPGVETRLVGVSDRSGTSDKWALHGFEPSEGVVGALAVADHTARLRLRHADSPMAGAEIGR